VRRRRCNGALATVSQEKRLVEELVDLDLDVGVGTSQVKPLLDLGDGKRCQLLLEQGSAALIRQLPC